jgi:hypothetical protein
MEKNRWLEEHAFGIGFAFWVASVICMVLGCILFTVGFNAAYWSVLPMGAFAPYAILAIPLIIAGFIFSALIIIVWYYAY